MKNRSYGKGDKNKKNTFSFIHTKD